MNIDASRTDSRESPSLKETWREVLGWPEYEVSDHGRVRRIGRAFGATAGAVLRPQTNNAGRLYVSLCRAAQPVKRYVHHLVPEAFVAPRPDGRECAHFDGNPRNNHLSNLRWASPAANAADKKRHGTSSVPGYSHKGEEHPSSKLTSESVLTIKARLRAGESHQKIARDFDVRRYAVSDISRGKTWRHL